MGEASVSERNFGSSKEGQKKKETDMTWGDILMCVIISVVVGGGISLLINWILYKIETRQ